MTRRALSWLTLSLLTGFVGVSREAAAQTIRSDFFITNGTVNSQVVSGQTLYIGGSFTNVGPVTGAAVPIDAVTGEVVPGFPKVSGQVIAVAPDGAGGWYIGGAFTSVGGVPRSNLAHILSDNTLSSWDPGANSTVRAIAVADTDVFIGGNFTSAGGLFRGRIAALDATTGLARAWNPNANSTVFALAASGGVVYAGGQFTTIGGQARNRIAALDVATGLATSWNPNANSQVSAILLDGAIVYAAGSFTVVGGQPRNRLAALDPGTGLASSWNPNANNTVLALATGPGTVYAGGTFTTVGGQSRNRIVAIDASTGVPTSWNPGASAQVLALAFDSGTLYAGGDFLTLGGQTRSRIAAIDATTGVPTAWNPTAYSTVAALATTGPVVFAGGMFTGMGGVVRNNLAAFDVVSGASTAWDPNANGQILAIATRAGTIFAGGQFTQVGGQPRANLAALDGGTGAATSWNPGTDGQVSAFTVNDSTLYVGGLFSVVGGMSRANLAAVDVNTAVVRSWNPGANDQIFTLTTQDGTVYAGGQFTTLGGQNRNRVGAVDAASGSATGWNPDANGTVRALAASCGTVYVGGFFTSIGGQARSDLAALEATSGLATSWNPTANGPLFALNLSGPTLYAGGVFNIIGGQLRNRIAALSVASGQATPWDPNANGTIRSIETAAGVVYGAGGFTAVGGQGQTNVVAISADTTLQCPAIALSPTLPAGRDGTPYSTVVTASGGSGPYCFAITAGGLPPPLSLNASGAITGTPDTAGTFAFTVTATDAGGCSGSRAYSLLVRPPCPVIAILPASLPAGRALEAYSQLLTAPAATPPLTWSKITGFLPSGLVINPSTGSLAGTPAAAGNYSFTIGVSDSNQCTGSQAYTLTIRPVCPVVAIQPPVLPDGTVGTSFTQMLAAEGAALPVAWSLGSGALPAGLTLDSVTGVITGTPSATGTSTFNVVVTDSNLCVTSRSFTVTMFATPPLSSVAANATGRSISVATPCVNVPVLLTRGESAPLRAVSVTFKLDSKLVLCTPGSPASSVHPGSWLAGFATTSFQVVDHGGGCYTVDQAILGSPCGATDGGELFTLDLASAGGDGFGVITIAAVKARNCDNVPVAIGPGPAASLAVCNAPLAMTPVLPDGSVGTAYSRTLTTLSGTPPFVWSVTSGTLPSGLTLDSGTGTVSGTPLVGQNAVFTVAVLDPNGCGGSRGYTMTIFPQAPASSVAVNSAGRCVSSAHPCVSVPIVFQRAEAVPARAMSVTFQLDPSKLSLCTPETPESSIHMGSWLASFSNTNFVVTAHGGGSYTVDQAILGSPCGATNGGELFTIDLQAVGGEGVGTITLLAAKARGCDNAPIPVFEGPVASLPIDLTLPTPITDLAAVQVSSGNGTGSTTGIAVSWSTGGAGTVALYRAPFGAYPIYDRDAPVAPPDPAAAPGAPWQLVTASAVSGYVDHPPRGFWYYVTQVVDECENRSVASNRTSGALDYVLGDVSNGLVAGQGDNEVRTGDVSLLGAYYGISGAAIGSAGVEYLDVGPTIDGLPVSRPKPDGTLDFEDLMIFSANFGTGATVPQAVIAGTGAANLGTDEFSLAAGTARAAGDTIAAVIRLRGAGRLQGFSLRLTWDPTVVVPMATNSGGLLESQGGVMLTPRLGTVDAALLGLRGTGMSGEGEVATVIFRALRSGDPKIQIASLIARGADNHPITVGVPEPVTRLPVATRLDAVVPNPGRGRTTVWFSLAQSAAVDVAIYSVDGRRARSLLHEPRPAGVHQILWDGTDDQGGRVGPGIYYVRLTTPQGRFTRKLVFIR